MDRFLSPILFSADFRVEKRMIQRSHRLITAKDAGFKENWLQQAIAEDPEVVLGPCREAGLILPKDEEWRFWGREVGLGEAGGISIDVLLLSESGRIGIVETKLAYNPQARREVVAQALEYAIHLPSMAIGELPAVPEGHDHRPFVDPDIIQDKVEAGDYLLIIAGDQLDPRAVKLSKEVLRRHMIHGWDLALVEVAVFQEQEDSGRGILVPHLNAAVAVEERQVFHIRIDENRTRVEVERTPGAVTVNRRKWDEDSFFAAMDGAAAPLRDFAVELRRLRDTYSGLTFEFGTAKEGSLILKMSGSNILEFYPGYGGYVRFRPTTAAGEDNFVNAFGERLGKEYRKALEVRFKRSMEMSYPTANFQSDRAQEVLPILGDVLKKLEAIGPRPNGTTSS